MPVPQIASTEISWDRIRSGWKTIALCVAVAWVGGAAVLTLVTPRQEVQAQLLVEPRDSLLSRAGNHRDKEYLPTQAEIISSPSIVQAAVERLELGLPPEQQQAAALGIIKDLKVDPLAGTNTLSIRYSHSSPTRAAAVVDALVAAYREYLIDSERRVHQRLIQSASIRNEELQSEIAGIAAELEVVSAASREDLFPLVSQTLPRIMAEVDRSLTETRRRKERLEESVEILENSSASGEGKAIILSELARLRGEGLLSLSDPYELDRQYQELATEEQTLQTLFGPKHAELAGVRANLAAISERRDQLIVSAVRTVGQVLAAARREEQQLLVRRDQLSREAREAEQLAADRSRGAAELERLKQSFEANQDQLREWRTAVEAGEQGHLLTKFEVLKPAIASDRPFLANPLAVLGLSGLIGCLTGVLLLTWQTQISGGHPDTMPSDRTEQHQRSHSPHPDPASHRPTGPRERRSGVDRRAGQQRRNRELVGSC